jgi:hypothetical protein
MEGLDKRTNHFDQRQCDDVKSHLVSGEKRCKDQAISLREKEAAG